MAYDKPVVIDPKQVPPGTAFQHVRGGTVYVRLDHSMDDEPYLIAVRRMGEHGRDIYMANWERAEWKEVV